jgi:hypothetical protein
MDRNYLIKKKMIRFFLLFFLLNPSVSVPPGCFVLNYGLYGELVSVFTIESQESAVYAKPAKVKPAKRYETIAERQLKRQQYMPLMRCYFQKRILVTSYRTPVRLKVRMNN